MRLTFDRKTIQALNIDIQPPLVGEGGIKDFLPNPERKSYYVWDTGNPPGFGIYIGRKAKTFVVQVRVGRKVKKVKVGVYGMIGTQANSLGTAREAAAVIVAKLKNGVDVTNERRHGRQVLSQSVNDVIDSYLQDYEEKFKKNNKKPRQNTVKAILAAKRRFESTGDKLLSELTGADIEKVWVRIKDVEGHRTAAEQTIRWGEAAFKHAIAKDIAHATVRGGQPVIKNNPFKAVADKLRTRSDLQRQAKENAKKNPLSMERGTLGLWLDVLWNKRTHNPNAADYFLCTLFLGTRRDELTHLVWGDRLRSPEERVSTNHINVDTREIILPITKNGITHELPLPRFIWHILYTRYLNRGNSPYVFPARKPNKKRSSNYYSDPRSFLASINQTLAEKIKGTFQESLFTWVDKTSSTTTKLKSSKTTNEKHSATQIKLSMHDLRRTFATIAASIPMPYFVTKKLLNHSVASDVTGAYVDLGREKIREYLQLIENDMVACSPNIKAYSEELESGI